MNPSSPDRYAIERIAQSSLRVIGLFKPLELAPCFRGSLLFGSDDETSSLVLYRFQHEGDFKAFRESTAALAILGPLGAPGETLFPAHPIKTFGASA